MTASRLTRLLLSSLLLAGCTATDPYHRMGMWQPTGAPALNVAAMVQNPRDLIRGRGTSGFPGAEAAPGVTRYWEGKPLPLPTSDSQTGGAGQGRAGSTAAGTN